MTLFAASSAPRVDPIYNGHFVTDGPFMHRSISGELFMIWSSFIKGSYAELAVKFKNGRLGTDFEHMTPLFERDGGHGMIFSDGSATYLTYHTPNKSLLEHPEFLIIEDGSGFLQIKQSNVQINLGKSE